MIDPARAQENLSFTSKFIQMQQIMISLATIIAALQLSCVLVSAQTQYFIFSTDNFVSKPRPAGNPSAALSYLYSQGNPTLDSGFFDYWGHLPTAENQLQTGNCCIRDAFKQKIICGREGACCAICQVGRNDYQTPTTKVIDYILSISQLQSCQAPPGSPVACLKPIRDPKCNAGVSMFNNFDYYGQLATYHNQQVSGTCCIRGKESQIAACGREGACCGSCIVSKYFFK